MKGRVYKRGNIWYYRFDTDPDPLSGKRRQVNGSGYSTEREAWKECRAAMAEHESGRVVDTAKRKVAAALTEWLARIEHSIKPSMAQNWRNYARYYVIPYIGERDVKEIDGRVCDALYGKLLAEGRVKAKPKTAPKKQPVHVRRVSESGKVQWCRPYCYDDYRCYRYHSEDDPLLGQPVERSKRISQPEKDPARPQVNPGLEPKTVVNTHRMLHRAWEDFESWGWAKRNFVADAHPPRVPRKGRKVWTVTQLQTFLQRSRQDRFFALWVLEATSGMRRCELAGANRKLLDLDAGTLDIGPTRVVVDGKVNAQHVLALDPFTLEVLRAHVGQLDQERRDIEPDSHDEGWLFCWENGTPRHPDTITRRFKRLSRAAALPEIDLHDVRHSYATAGRNAKIDWKALSKRIGHADVAFTMKHYVQTDLESDREVATILADLIVGGLLVTEVDAQADEPDREAGE